MKKITPIIIIAVLVVVGIIFVPRLAHTCDSCETFFVGAGYEPNLIEDFFSQEDKIICKSCAQEQHAIAIAMGQSLDDFKRDLFE